MKNLILRTISGIVYVALIVAGVLVNSWTLLGLLVVLVVFGLLEFSNISRNANKNAGRLWSTVADAVGGCLLVATFWCLSTGRSCTSLVGTLYLCYLLVRYIVEIYTANPSPLASMAGSMLAQVYVALPLALMCLVPAYTSNHVLLAMFVFVWINDTGAFIVGSSIGRHRLFPRISPKKSWEGFWGGVVFCVGAGVALRLLWPQYFGILNEWQMVGLAILVAVFATWGDLVESMIKRSLQMKDSGKLMPGHGGILDRIDSLLVVAPATVCYLNVIELF